MVDNDKERVGGGTIARPERHNMNWLPKPLLVLVTCFVLAGCAPDFSTGTAAIASSVADIKSASHSITETYVDSRQQFYIARGIVHHRALAPAPGCFQGDLRECYLIDPIQQALEKTLADEISRQLDDPASAPQPTPVTEPVSGYVATINQMIKGSFPGATPIEVVSKIAVPDACRREVSDHLADPQPAMKAGPVPNEAAIVGALDDYAQALAAITRKSDVDDYKTAATKLAISVGTLASTLGTLAGGAGAAVGPVATAVVKIGTDAYVAILEQRRYEALKTAVLAACIPVHNLAYSASITLRARSNVAMRDLQYVANDAVHEKGLTQADLKQLYPMQMQAVATLRTVAFGDAGSPAMKLVGSHNKLVEEMLSGKGESLAFLKLAAELATDAKNLKEDTQPKSASAGK